MGKALIRGWSFSRSEMFAQCPRKYFYEYYPFGEDNAYDLGVLKHATTLPQLVGTIAHDAIGISLKQYMAKGTFKEDINDYALIRYDNALRMYTDASKRILDGKAVKIKRPSLLHQLLTGPSKTMEDAARETLIEYLDTFRASAAVKALRLSDRMRWERVPGPHEKKDFVEASRELGFGKSIGLRIYTPLDLALKINGKTIIVDWKTGKKDAGKLAKALQQTVGYSFWALNRGVPFEQIRVQPFWLQENEEWDPKPITADEVDAVRSGIEEFDGSESALITERVDSKSNVTFHASIDKFKARPGPLCGTCKYQFVCADAAPRSRSVEFEI